MPFKEYDGILKDKRHLLLSAYFMIIYCCEPVVLGYLGDWVRNAAMSETSRGLTYIIHYTNTNTNTNTQYKYVHPLAEYYSATIIAFGEKTLLTYPTFTLSYSSGQIVNSLKPDSIRYLSSSNFLVTPELQ